MYLSLFKEMVHQYVELTTETEQNEDAAKVLPRRCEICQNQPYCDRDYCLCWYH
jgi:hypothetical protein